VLWNGATGPDFILDTVASLGVVWIVWSRPELPYRLRLCLAVYFGLEWATWLVHLRWLNQPTMYVYKAGNLLGLSLFPWASVGPERSLKAI
jgi:hypothetical protein